MTGEWWRDGKVGMRVGTVRMVTEYQVLYYHTMYVLVKAHLQVIENEGDRGGDGWLVTSDW